VHKCSDSGHIIAVVVTGCYPLKPETSTLEGQ